MIKGQIKMAFYFTIDHHIRDRIIKCMEEGAFRVLGTKRELDATKLDAFIALLYARSAYQAKNLDVSYLWNKIWRPAFFSKTISRNDFAEIMRFIRFDRKSERSQRLRTNKFAMVSTIWDQFTENLQNCYKLGCIHYFYIKYRGKKSMQ